MDNSKKLKEFYESLCKMVESSRAFNETETRKLGGILERDMGEYYESFYAEYSPVNCIDLARNNLLYASRKENCEASEEYNQEYFLKQASKYMEYIKGLSDLEEKYKFMDIIKLVIENQ